MQIVPWSLQHTTSKQAHLFLCSRNLTKQGRLSHNSIVTLSKSLRLFKSVKMAEVSNWLKVRNVIARELFSAKMHQWLILWTRQHPHIWEPFSTVRKEIPCHSLDQPILKLSSLMIAPSKNGQSSIRSWTGCASTKPIQGTRTCQWRFWTPWFCSHRTDRTKCSADWIRSSNSRSQTSIKWYHSPLDQEGTSQWDKAKTWTFEIKMPVRIKACMGAEP